MEKTTSSIDEVIMHYAEKWAEEYDSEMPIVNKFMKEKDYFDKGIKFLIDYYFKHQPFGKTQLPQKKS